MKEGTFMVSGSHGQVSVDAATGKVTSTIKGCSCGDKDCNYATNIYDVKEWQGAYSGIELKGQDIDILDLRYTTAEGVVEEVEQSWRVDRAARCISFEDEDMLADAVPYPLLHQVMLAIWRHKDSNNLW